MYSELFHTTAILNYQYQLRALNDPGSSAIASISQKYINKFTLKTDKISPKVITGVLNNISGIIHHVASFSLDIGGLFIKKFGPTWLQTKPRT